MSTAKSLESESENGNSSLVDWFAVQSGHVTLGIRGKTVISILTSGNLQPSGHTSPVMAGRTHKTISESP